MKNIKQVLSVGLMAATAIAVNAAPTVQIRLPERFRLLNDQRFDLRVEATTLTEGNATVQVLVNGVDVTATLPAPEVTANNDLNPADPDVAWTFRSHSFPSAGVKTVVVNVTDSSGSGSAATRIGVQEFRLPPGQPKKNIILYIGDAMGTAYRDSGRIVANSLNNGFREGFFDTLQSMDTMPACGMVMTYALDRIVPDSANTGTAWASGNKTVDGTLNVFPDNTDDRYTGGQSTKAFALDNPRVETLWEYLRRLHGYKTGIVTTSDVTDATPAAQGAHSLDRGLLTDIAKQYVDGIAGFSPGPHFDVILGGGLEQFNARTTNNSGDARNLVDELIATGFTVTSNRTELQALPGGAAAPSKLLGLFRTSHMNVAYDKLGFIRPSDEPLPSFSGFNDQPFLEEMTEKAIATLSKGGTPFVLMVEGASIDKQSHPNHAAGVIWDVIEFDKSVAVGRQFGANNASPKNGRTLVLVTADHDQSMSIVGLSDAQNPRTVLNTRSISVYPLRVGSVFRPAYTNYSAVAPSNAGNNPGEVSGFPDYVDANGDGYPENTNRFRITVGFRTGNHTGSSVPITADGPGAILFTGYQDQTDICWKMAKILSSNTAPLDELMKHTSNFSIVNQNY